MLFLYNLWLDIRQKAEKQARRRCCSTTISTSCSASFATS